jgi:hypothetical protein
MGAHRFRFFFGVFKHGNDLWQRKFFPDMDFGKIVSVPLGHPPFVTILGASAWRVAAINNLH